VVVTFRRFTIAVQIVLLPVLAFLIFSTLNHDFMHPPGGAPCTTDVEPLFHGLVDRGWYLVAVPLALLVGRLSVRGQPPKKPPDSLTSDELSERVEDTKKAPAAGEPAAPAAAVPAEPPAAGPNIQLAGLGLGTDLPRPGTSSRVTVSALVAGTAALGREAARLTRANIVQGVLTVFILVAFAGLLYETIQVARGAPEWPLTFFVRCLNEGSESDLTSVPTFVVTIVVAVILGSWLWAPRPGKRGQRDQEQPRQGRAPGPRKA